MPEKLEGHSWPRRTVVGQLSQQVFEVVRRDRATQSLPRCGGDTRDAIGAEWEIRILRGLDRPMPEPRAGYAPPFYRASSLVVGRDWNKTLATAAHTAGFGGLGLGRQFRLPGTEPVCYPLYQSLLSLEFCTESPLLSKGEDPTQVSRLDAGDADRALDHSLGPLGPEVLLESSQGPTIPCRLNRVRNVGIERWGVRCWGSGMQQVLQLSTRVKPGDGVTARAFRSGLQLAAP